MKSLHSPHARASARPAARGRRRPWFAVAVLAAGASAAVRAEEVPMVAVAPVVRQDLAKTLSVQAEFRPYQEIELHAKVAGYLREIKVDIGDHVKAGEVFESGDDLAGFDVV